MNVIIFLAPMSGFNQVLAEDESVNRLVRYPEFLDAGLYHLIIF